MTNETPVSDFIERFGRGTIFVFVGAEKRAYSIHKKLACSVSNVFAQQINQYGVVHLQNESIEIFDQFVVWLYSQELRCDGPWKSENLVKLYIFAIRMEIPSYQDLIIDKIQDGCHIGDGAWPLDENDARVIFREPITVDTPIRKFCVAMFQHWMDKYYIDKAIIADLCRNCHGFAYDILCYQYSKMACAPDPHFRREDEVWFPICHYHVHEKGEPCKSQPHDDQKCTDCQ